MSAKREHDQQPSALLARDPGAPRAETIVPPRVLGTQLLLRVAARRRKLLLAVVRG